MSKVLIEEQHLRDIADAIRSMTGKHETMTTDSMAAEIREAAIVRDPEEKWQRPIEWPDYSQIDLTDFEGMYFTYDTSRADHYNDWAGIYCACSGGYKVDKGQIVNGEFVIEQTTTKSTGSVFEEFLEPTITGYVVYRITAATAGRPITSVRMADMSATLRGDRTSRTYYYQPLVERYGRLPNLTSFTYWGNCYVYSDTILDLKKITTLANMWIYSQRIENIDLTGFEGEPVSCSQAFYQCRRLRYLNETDKFVTSACTNMYYMFNECQNLRFVDCENWDTSNVTTMHYLFNGCFNLYKADVSKWDVSKVTAMGYMFQNCTKLKEIDVSNWVVTLPTSYYCMFANCNRVEKLDLSGFDSSNVTTMYQMFYNCVSLQELDISSLRTPKVTSMYAMFYQCRSLNSLDVSNFDTSKVTTFSGMFQNVNNISELDISNFSFAACTNITNFLNGASGYSRSITLPSSISSGKMSGTTINSAFASLSSVMELDLTGFDWSGVTAPEATCRYDYFVEKIILPSSLHYIGANFFGDDRNLKTIVLPSTTLVTLTNTNAFSGATHAKTIYVPDNLVASYQAADNWSSLTNVTFAGLSTYEE